VPERAAWPFPAGDGLGKGDGISRGRLQRTLPLVALGARTTGNAIVAGLRSKLTGADASEFHARTAERYVELLGRSKGALMKAGQVLSYTGVNPAVPAEFRSVYETALASLRSDAPPMAGELARAVLERELGRRTESAFAEFDPEPLAAASIGQVHGARLHDGRAVAVKIQYPGVAEAIHADLKNAELLTTFLSLLLSGMSSRRPSFDLSGAAREMSVRITEELDYRLEAAHQAEFAEHYRGHPFIRVPEVVSELSTARVLTQELAQGLSWSDGVKAGQELRDQWAEAIWRFTYGSYRRLHMFNADPHPGNYVLHEDGGVSFLDYGCVKRFSGEQIQVIDAIARACLRDDVLGTWRMCVEAGFFNSSDAVTPEEAFAYLRGDWEMFWARERFVLTPEYVARWIEHRFSPSGPSANALRHFKLAPEYTFAGRMELGMVAVIAQLHPGNRWGAMAAEHLEAAPPLTAMGKCEHAFFEERQVAGPV
jgi:predicted unusual protein kinase regulating ubiquinone biosynthesis (AarF/ABC1/UbiB family)